MKRIIIKFGYSARFHELFYQSVKHGAKAVMPSAILYNSDHFPDFFSVLTPSCVLYKSTEQSQCFFSC